jgi:hypothetical protein
MNIFVCIVIAIMSTAEGPTVQTLATPYETAEQCNAASQKFVDYVNQSAPDGLLSAKVGCIKVEIIVPEEGRPI